MRINRVEIENFKSIRDLSFDANDCNILVGANASGKTNIIQVFEFLKNIKTQGINNAVGEFGGILNLKNFNSSKSTLSIKVELDAGEMPIGDSLPSYQIKRRRKISYEITLVKRKSEFDIREELEFVERYQEENIDGDFIQDLTTDFRYSIKNSSGKFELPSNEKLVKRYELSTGEELKLKITTPFPVQFIEELNANFKNRSLLEYPGVFIPSELFNFGIYDFEPKKVKNLVNDTYAKRLDKNGGNLALVIKNILNNKENKEQFIADLAAILDFIDDVSVTRIDTYLKLGIKESYNKSTTDGFLLSDGTINIIAVLVALYYQENQII